MHAKVRFFLTVVFWFALDVILAAVIVVSAYIFSYKVPHKLPSMNIPTTDVSAVDFGEAFSSCFSDTVIFTENSYRSPNISIEISQVSLDSGRPDSRGKTKIVYSVADIYVRDISCFRTAFAEDTYGIGYSQRLEDIAADTCAVLAVNGDSYSSNHWRNNGTLIRNGIVYRASDATEDTCVLFKDGSIALYPPGELDANEMVEKGAWQSWVFGPSLLDSEGKAISHFEASQYVMSTHPRTALGYYEPGHYCLVVVDGRQDSFSRGMYLDELSQLFEDLGCTIAYNLDGGHCSCMTLFSQIVTHPYYVMDDISDGLVICEPQSDRTIADN